MDIKLRVSDDVLREYANEKRQLNQDIDTARDEYKSTDEGRKKSQEAADKVMHEAEKCAEEQVRAGRPNGSVQVNSGQLKGRTGHFK